MRDSLTALAGAVILILVAALAVPPFVDWAGHRPLVDRAVARSLGLPVRSEGRIELRLLPSPRVRFDRLQVGADGSGQGLDAPVLDTHYVKAEVALAPLLKGEVRFTETRIGRAEIRLPVTEGDGFALPAGVVEAAGERDLVIEDLHVQQLLVTTQVARTGRTDQFVADNVHLTAGSLLGPWQIEGASGGTRFRFASSRLARDDSVTVKVSGGGDTRPRFEADARIALVPLKVPADPAARPGAEAARARPRIVVPEAEGTARLVVGPPTQAAGAYLPFSLAGRFKARGPIARFEGVNAEIDPGGKAIRLAGSGQVDLRAWRAALDLEARRIDLDGFLLSPAGQALIARGAPAAGGLPILLDLGLKLDSLALGFDDWSEVAMKATFDRTGGLVLRQFQALAPGAARIAASGEVDLGPAPGFTGHLDLDAPNSEGLGRILRRVGLDGGLGRLLDGRALRATADLSATSLDLSLRNLRLGLGEASVTGNARYTAAGPGGRGRFDAQVGARGIDIAELPPVDGLTQGLRGVDLGLTLQARDMRYGPAGSGTGTGNGTIAARIQSDGAGLAVDSLDVTDLAGANATLSGRIGPDGSGRIAGRVSAPVAAPLLALLDRLWIPETRLVPGFLREGALGLDLALERDAGAAETLRATARGRAGGGTVDLTALTRGGRLARLDAGLATQQAGAWFGRGDLAALRRPATLTLAALRGSSADAPLGLTVSGTLAGLAVATPVPIALAADQGAPEGGSLRIETDDVAPLLALAGAVLPPGPQTAPLPAALTLDLSRAGSEARAAVSGTLAGLPVSGRLARAADGAVTGSGALQRLSLPALVGALALPTEARGGDPGAARFLPAPAHPRAEIDLTVARLDLGRGLVAEEAGFRLGLDGDALGVRGLSGRLAGGTLKGGVAIARAGGGATVTGEGSLAEAAIPALAGPGPLSGRVSATLRFGATGESLDGLAGALSGSGEIRLAGLGLANADPGAIGRTVTRALTEEDPLREGRLQGLLAEEFGAGPLAQTGAATAAATLGAGTLRAGPLALDLGSARWAGTLGIDLRARRLDARGTLTATAAPKGWTAGLPAVQFGLAGPWTAPERAIDGGPLTNGLAALVLQRELEKIELFDADQSERQRRRARIEMDRARVAERAAAERAAAERAAAERAAAERAAAEKLAADRAAAAEAARRAAESAPAPEPAPQP